MRIGIPLTALAAIALAAGPALAADGPKDFTVIAKTDRWKSTEKRYESTETLFDGLRGERIGAARNRCRFPGDVVRCTARYQLPGGSLLARGRVREVRLRVEGENKASTLPIVSGTGAYRNASGKVLFNAIARRLSQIRFNFR